MLRREAELPGFGGFYIDSLDRMVVYMKDQKTASRIPDTAIRKTLVRAYSRRSEPRIQGLISEVAKAQIIPADFSLSELIAIENRIGQSTVIIPGYTGVGTSLITNRVVVGFIDSADVEPGLSAIRSMGIPSQAVVGEVWGNLRVASDFDQANPIRPTRGGLWISIHNFTAYPWDTVYNGVGGIITTTKSAYCSIGFNARWYPVSGPAVDYLVTASHCANFYRGVNGVTGDTVFQPKIVSDNPPLLNAVGFVAVNEPWGGPCGPNPADGTPTDFCHESDAMLVRYIPGISGERKLATSQYAGANGNVGSMHINNWHPIGSVVAPEWIAARPSYGVHKSGFATGTTTGGMQLPYTQAVTRMCWTFSNCPAPGGHSGGKQVNFFGIVKVTHAGVGHGDSGGVVFGGNGAPYYALGIVVMAGGFKSTDKDICTNGANCHFLFLPWAAVEQSVKNVLGPGTLNPVTTQ